MRLSKAVVCGGLILAGATQANAGSVDAKLLDMLKANGSITAAQHAELSADLVRETLPQNADGNAPTVFGAKPVSDTKEPAPASAPPGAADTPPSFAVSSNVCPAFRRTCTAWRFSMSIIPSPAAFHGESGPRNPTFGVARISGRG